MGISCWAAKTLLTAHINFCSTSLQHFCLTTSAFLTYPKIQAVLHLSHCYISQGRSQPIDLWAQAYKFFGLITLLLVINYALLGWAKKLKRSKCWWGQTTVMRAIFGICGNESQPGLQIVKKLATLLLAVPSDQVMERLKNYLCN